MPTYEYECTKCGGITEVFQGITERPKRTLDCAACGERTPVRRLLGAGAGVLFKGSGFYATDYRSDSYKKAAKAEDATAEAKTDSGKSSASVETKTDTAKTKASAE
ncbi:MAG: FmdB family zinc ribbon protein [Planctomycetota bacterium]